jgi:hypothetical protein
MLNNKLSLVPTSYLLALAVSIAPLTFVNAQNLTPDASSFKQTQLFSKDILPEGTIIPIMSQEGNKILLLPEESMAITLLVAENIENSQGKTIIPANTEVRGQLGPYRGGTRFVAQDLVFPNGRQYYIDAVSEVVTRTEVVKKGVNSRSILQGAVVGAAAATVLAAVTGDNAIATEEVLGGAGFGALAGWLFGNKRSQELISINPNQDLDLTLISDFAASRARQ